MDQAKRIHRLVAVVIRPPYATRRDKKPLLCIHELVVELCTLRSIPSGTDPAQIIQVPGKDC